MQSDIWGHRLSTDSAEAAEATSRGVASFVRLRTDAMGHLQAAAAADPDFGLPNAIMGLIMVGLRKPQLYGAARGLLEKARSGRPPETERERRYIAALELALAGGVTDSVMQMEAVAQDNPHDIFALRNAQYELFWIGEVDWMRDISERAAPHWSPDTPAYSSFLSVRSFGLEETGDYAKAEAFGREAVTLDPADCWGAHSVAHVLIMQGRLDEGVGWVDGLASHWAGSNHIVHHLWWHQALFHVEKRDYAAALAVYDGRLRDLNSPLMKAMDDFVIDIQNDVALLQRLELRGVDVGDRWGPVGDLAAGRIGNHTSPFTSAHCVLALAAAGRFGEASETIRQMRAFVAEDRGSLGPRYALAALPAGEGALAHRRGDHAKAVEIMGPARRNLWQMGGSHAQRDLFFQILADSAMKTGRSDLLRLLFDDFATIGLEHLEERSSYADALASLH